MVWIAIVLGVFLFYRFVERKHKILTFKVGGAIALTGGLGICCFLCYDSYKERRRSRGIAVELEIKDPNLSKVFVQGLVDIVFNGMIPTVDLYYPNLSGVDRGKVKEQLFYSYLEVKDSDEYALVFSNEELVALFSWANSKNAEAEKKLRSFEEARLKKWSSELTSRRAKSITSVQKFLHDAFLSRGIESFSFDEYRKDFLDKMTSEERNSVNSFIELKDVAYDKLYAVINSRSELNTLFSFRVCNMRSRPLESYSFDVSGFDRGRSTPRALRKPDNYLSSTHFSGDIIVEPNKCKAVQWTGDYKFYSRYEIKAVIGTWKD